MNNLPCNCTASSFRDLNHEHIVTGDTRILQSNELRKLPCKGPKYREPVSINFSNYKTEIKNSLTKFSSDWCNWNPCQMLYTMDKPSYGKSP